jgi:2-methylaconitate cis-trans-isomerase PrpF
MRFERASVPVTYMRGGTSKALFFHEHDLPPRGEQRDQLILRFMGSPDPMQIDGMGGSHVVTSKVAIVKPSEREDADIDYTFVQVGIDSKTISYKGNCGNISAAVGPFALNEGLVKILKKGISLDGKLNTVEVRIFNTGSKKVLVSHVPIDSATGRPLEKGDFAIAGCPGTGAPILMDYKNVSRVTISAIASANEKFRLWVVH